MPFLARCEVATPCWSRQLGFCGFEVQQSWNRYKRGFMPAGEHGHDKPGE
jgi:hypothetical protein